MGRIRRELSEVLIPPQGSINHYDGQVSVYYTVGGTRRRTVIGKAASETTMYVNDNYKFLFPELWKQNFGQSNAPLPQIHAVCTQSVSASLKRPVSKRIFSYPMDRRLLMR